MGSLQQQQELAEGTNRVTAVGACDATANDAFDHEDQKHQQRYLCSNASLTRIMFLLDLKKPGWRNFLSYVGPGFLVSLAYLDPGNLETDLQAGANHRYELLWVILIGLIFALIIQSLAANLGVSTGKHLSELCKAEYPTYVKYCLWLLAEIAVISADIPEGMTSNSYVRKLEILIALLVFIMAACFFGEMSYVKPPAADVLKGMFIPKLSGQGATGDAIALLGALVMPYFLVTYYLHNLFLHSALVLSRKIPSSVRGINDACRYFLIESGFALFVAFLINVSVISVSGTVCSDKNLSKDGVEQCSDLTLNSASFLLKNVLGKSSSTVYAIALLASGQSSTITGTYAGQYIMQGFLDLKMRKWIRNLVTRCIAITPSLIVSIIGGSSGAGRLIIIASMILSFELPFALIPLLKFSSSTTKMGPHKNSIYIIVVSWILGMGIIGINIYYLTTGFVRWLTHNDLPKVGSVLIGILVFPLMAIYIFSVLYLVFRKDTVVTFIDPTKLDVIAQKQMEDGHGNSEKAFELKHVPYREDLADIPLPR
ncbi:hypothetical protein RJ640_006133 [Escallonia rubra]|uniref:Uncharacterized protein n=1 Tax=Escallonia rubra TaxID=112253 RepID=A0AA88RT64_9ASTE|nr:hypothetical protein RJ640_006133 [Escallonia rubra]